MAGDYQLVKHMDEVPDSAKHPPYLLQVKYDGVFCDVIHDGKSRADTVVNSRTSKPLYISQNMRALYCNFPDRDAPAGHYIAELCNPHCSLEVLSGLVNPNRVKRGS